MIESSENPKLAPWRDALLIVLLAPALVAGCYSAGFLEYDDGAHYNHELVLLDSPWKDFAKVSKNTYFPVVVLSYRLDRYFFESVPPAPIQRSKAAPGVRFHSLLLHVLAGIFLWRALLHLRVGRWMSLFAATAWTLHPAACESVCWISERKNVLAAFFGFASLWVYFGGVRNTWCRALATGGLFALAMLSKPNAAGFLPVYFVYEVWEFVQRRSDVVTSGERAAITPPNIVPTVLLWAGCAGLIVFLAKLNFRTCDSSTVTLAGGSLWTVALTDVPIVTEYIYNSVIPSGLSIFYYSPIVTTLASVFFWTRLATLVAMLAGTIWISSQRWRTVFLWGWFFGTLGPALNLVPIPYLMQDRYAYFALPAIVLIAAETAVRTYEKVRLWSNDAASSHRKMGQYAAIGASVFVAAMAVLRSGVYRNDYELQSDGVRKQPQSSYAQMHHALTLSQVADLNELSGKGDSGMIRTTREAVLAHLQLCEACPDFDRMLDPGRVRLLVGVTLERLGRVDLAYPALLTELKQPQKPYNIPAACAAMARMELLRGRADDGLAWLEYCVRAASLPQLTPEMLYLKGNCLEQLKRFTDARAVYAVIPTSSLAYDRAQARLKVILNEP